jgi:EAL domain-containing protein (putative c-di-GMP-specific phosphodiesterase class I)
MRPQARGPSTGSPIHALADGRIDGFEALVRWQHPLHGLVSPGAFLSVAEESGLMPQLTDFVLHFACRTVRQWQSLHPSLARLKVSVNLSGNDVAHPALLARVTRALVESGLHPRNLVLELTEDILASRLEGALPVLTDLRKLGVELAVDDFGTGYSSLAHLARLPIGTLKIDRSFVSGLQETAEQAAVVRAVVTLGASLGKRVVAEGIEQASQRETLRSLGCDYGQGHHLGRPLPAEATEAMLREHLDMLPAPVQRATTPDFAGTQSGLLH